MSRLTTPYIFLPANPYIIHKQILSVRIRVINQDNKVNDVHNAHLDKRPTTIILNTHYRGVVKNPSIFTHLAPKNIAATVKSNSGRSSTLTLTSTLTSTNDDNGLNSDSWLHLSRSQCEQRIIDHNLGSVRFAQLLFLNDLNLLLTFEHQRCVAITVLNETSKNSLQ